MEDRDYMKLAIQLAQNTLGQTSPNPVVGAVLVKDGRIIGMGAHLKAGEEHAEIQAFKMAKKGETENATLYVTLEPCSHFGKTPPCVNAIIEHKVKRVVVATLDPNPLVSGKGVKKLEDAGIKVEVGLLEQEAIELNKFFLHFIKHKTPYVTIKCAMTMDGRIATSNGDSKWITSSEAREDVHQNRNIYDAILVGINTVIADNPLLTTRLTNGEGLSPKRIILDSNLRIPESAALLHDQKAETILLVGKNVADERIKQIESDFVKVIRLKTDRPEVKEVLSALGGLGVTSLYVEGGRGVHESFLKANCVNELHLYLAPKIVGGNFSSFGELGITNMQSAMKLDLQSVQQIGPDLKITAKLIEKESC
jgi:diaminohydroxyphosphoribosylaminopyrimidine deaminase/5-amino-6-(5-phosphoribosylamino)uracil reductase